jgi:hypothetical protein
MNERRHWTQPAESLMGIALRQLKDESRWTEIRDLNAASFPDMGPHDYYPVGTAIKLPAEPAQQDTKETPCGGCGATTEKQRCIGCLHQFAPQSPSVQQAAATEPTEDLHTFLDAAAGEGLVLGGIDAADLYIAIFPERYANLGGGAALAALAADQKGENDV